MKIKVNRKNLLEAAELCAKLVIPSKSPIEAMPNLRLSVSMKQHTTELLASNGEETVVASVIDSHPDSDCDTMINCAALLALLRSVASSYVTLEIHDRLLDIYTDDTPAGTLTATNAAGGPVAPSVPKSAYGFMLPTNFSQILQTAFKFSCKENDRPAILSGINLSPYGVTALDGHVLYHLPSPMRISGSLTLPRPILPPTMGNMPLSMKTWGAREYEIRGIGFMLYGKGMEGNYLDWQKVMFADSDSKGYFTLSGDLRELMAFLKSMGENGWADVAVSTSSLRFRTEDGRTFNCPAKTSCVSGTVLRLKGCNMLGAIEIGHDRFQFTDNPRLPIKATGGRGCLLFMAMKEDTTNTVNPDMTTGTTATKQTDSGVESSEAVVTNQNNTNQNKEKTEMTQSSTITRFPATTPQFQPQTQFPQQSQPLNAFEELEKLFEGLKATQAIYNEQMANISRKLKAAVTADRQRAREYNKAIGRLEAVRKAI